MSEQEQTQEIESLDPPTAEEIEETEETEKKPPQSDQQIIVINNMPSGQEDQLNYRNITMYGDINEHTSAELVSAMLFLESTSAQTIPDPENEAQELKLFKEINIFLSTHGGSLSDMFSVIDIMEKIKKNTCDISTYGIGKVMSAGVPILAAGTKGKRRIGRNCRIMLHGVSAGYAGNVLNLENELEEIKWMQKSYIECLASRTKLSKKKIKKMIKSQKEVYISAKQAIKYGIADEII